MLTDTPGGGQNWTPMVGHFSMLFDNYQVFTRLLGLEAQMGVIQRLGATSRIPLYGVWVAGDPKFLES